MEDAIGADRINQPRHEALFIGEAAGNREPVGSIEEEIGIIASEVYGCAVIAGLVATS